MHAPTLPLFQCTSFSEKKQEKPAEGTQILQKRGADGSAPRFCSIFSCGRRNQPVCCSFFSRVIPPTPTLTAATVRPVMDSTLLFTASCTARPTSGMVCP